MKLFILLATATTAAARCLPQYAMCPDFLGAPTCSDNNTGPLGTSPTDFTIIGPALQAVHESVQPPTGLALDNDYNIYLTYPRNSGQTPSNVVIADNFTSESPWPSASIQNCTAGQDVSTCFLNVQNVVLDSIGQMWIVDSGIPSSQMGSGDALPGGAKIMSFNTTTRQLIATYPIPADLLANGTNANDVRINNTLGTAGFAFITDESPYGSVLAGDLATNTWVKRLGNTTAVKADPKYVGSFDGAPLYAWNGTKKGYLTTGADGIALASGNMYWGALASRRFYYIPQSVLADFSLSDAEVEDGVVDPGQLGSEQAGFTADDNGRLYMLASEQNAIYYVDTQQSQVTEEVNGIPPGGSGPAPPENYVVKSLVRSGLIQHADSAAIMPDGYLYFCTNQLELRPANQYRNVDRRRGPFRSYRVYIGAGPAV
ncbi:Uu.00g029160.m01.CDS01 [Anthostomella pinea]|uniref:Uu.00g029160.m01.CDS01 n=1 Tax=Anthostomella pinea TaxID=933095 RepID=A0AAI8V381_9PEZI|nr:Uu.00g029160.m01.CDS01 [Anthostomella pinea]